MSNLFECRYIAVIVYDMCSCQMPSLPTVHLVLLLCNWVFHIAPARLSLLSKCLSYSNALMVHLTKLISENICSLISSMTAWLYGWATPLYVVLCLYYNDKNNNINAHFTTAYCKCPSHALYCHCRRQHFRMHASHQRSLCVPTIVQCSSVQSHQVEHAVAHAHSTLKVHFVVSVSPLPPFQDPYTLPARHEYTYNSQHLCCYHLYKSIMAIS